MYIATPTVRLELRVGRPEYSSIQIYQTTKNLHKKMFSQIQTYPREYYFTYLVN